MKRDVGVVLSKILRRDVGVCVFICHVEMKEMIPLFVQMYLRILHNKYFMILFKIIQICIYES